MKIQEINNAIALALKLTGYVNDVLVGYLDIPQASFTAPQVLLNYTGEFAPGNTIVFTATSDLLSDMTILIDGEIVALLYNALALTYSYTIPAGTDFTNISASATNSVGLSGEAYLNLEPVEVYAVQSFSSSQPNYNPAFQLYLYATEGIAENEFYTTQEEAAAVTAFTNAFTAEQLPELTHLDELGNFTSLTTIPLGWAVTIDMQTHTIIGATNLQSIVFPDSLTTIGDMAFMESGLTGLEIPEGVTSIGSNTFLNCTDLTSVTIGDDVTSLLYNTFSGCTSLASVYIGSGVLSIRREAFSRCTALTHIEVSSNNSTYDSRDNCNAIIETTSNTLEIGFLSTVIPSTVTTIGKWAFADCTSLLNITIPNTVTTIGRFAFKGTGLTAITLPNSITTWSDSVFMNCASLRSVVFNSGVTTVPNGYFHECTSLTEVIIPDSVTTIEAGAFDDCTALSTIAIPRRVSSIGNYAFRNTGLAALSVEATTPPTITTDASTGTFANVNTTIPVYVPANSITTYQNSSWGLVFSNIQDGTAYAVQSFDSSLPNYNPELQAALYNGGIVSTQDRTTMAEAASITSVGLALMYDDNLTSADELQYFGLTTIYEAFFDCANLQSVQLPNTVTAIGYSAFLGCSSLASINISDNISGIRQEAFEGCYSLTNVTIPNSVTSIGLSAFLNCINLTSVTLPESITTLETRTFYGCIALRNITIPSSVTRIGNEAFNSSGLYTVTVLATTPPSLGYSIFSNSPITEIKVPAESVSAYQAASGWSSYNIVPIS